MSLWLAAFPPSSWANCSQHWHAGWSSWPFQTSDARNNIQQRFIWAVGCPRKGRLKPIVAWTSSHVLTVPVGCTSFCCHVTTRADHSAVFGEDLQNTEEVNWVCSKQHFPLCGRRPWTKCHKLPDSKISVHSDVFKISQTVSVSGRNPNRKEFHQSDRAHWISQV